MAYTASLTTVRTEDIAAAGRKGTDLARLAAQKFTTADTMVVLSTAFDTVVQENNLQPKIAFLLSHVRPGDTASLMNVYTGVRRALSEAKLNPQLVAELQEAYASVAAEGIGLGKHRPVRVIVSTDQDENPENNDTVVQNVQDKDEFLIAVREAWALPFLPSQLQPRLEQKLQGPRIALLVQAMDDPVVSVHAYSCVPEDKEKSYILAYYGELDLREKIVKDYYAISRSTLHIVTSELNHQTNKLERKDGGYALVSLPDRHKDDKLIRREIEELARLAKKAERILEEPVKLFLSSNGERHVLLWANRLGFQTDAKGPQEPIMEAPSVEVVDVPPAKPKTSNARLLAVSLQLATRAVEKRCHAMGHQPGGIEVMLTTLNERNAFSRPVDALLLKRAAAAVASDTQLSDDEYARAVEEIAFLLANA